MGKTIVVVGGGASGLMAAITAAKEGAKVTILEQNSKLGKKILSTGNGRCNMTNLNQDLSYYRSNDPAFAEKVLSAFPMEDTLKFFHEIGIFIKNRNGYIYPRSNQASSVVDTLVMEAARLKIKCKTNEEVVTIQKTTDGFTVNTKTWHYNCDHVIIACGSKASLIEGSTGSGYKLAKDLSHTVIDPLPALVALKGTGDYFAKWAGVRTDATISLIIDNKLCVSDTGEVQLTDYGISGIPVFQVSRFASRALSKGQSVKVEIDFLPELSSEKILAYLKDCPSSKTIKEHLIGVFPLKLIEVLYKKKQDLSTLTKQIKHFEVIIKDTLDFSHAQICTGGVSCLEIDPATMESKIHPGIFFCGELVDVDGACGGYNLQWAWSSGYLAGKSASKE